jgi:hypothetical protein
MTAATGLVYLAQGRLVGSEGFSDNMSTAIVAAWILSAVWMAWLIVVAWPRPGRRRSEGAATADPERLMGEALGGRDGA